MAAVPTAMPTAAAARMAVKNGHKSLKWLDREVQSGRVSRDKLAPSGSGNGQQPFKSDRYMRSYSQPTECAPTAAHTIAHACAPEPSLSPGDLY